MNYISVLNNQTIPFSAIPEINYTLFLELNTGFVVNHSERHCVNYFGFPFGDKLKLMVMF